MNATRKPRKVENVADICLYGAPSCGYGWLASTADGRMFGTGEPRITRSLTDSLWYAALDLIGYLGERPQGNVRIFAPGGQRMAILRLAEVTRKYYGDLVWTPAPVLEISAEAIEAATSRD